MNIFALDFAAVCRLRTTKITNIIKYSYDLGKNLNLLQSSQIPTLQYIIYIIGK